MERFSAAAEPAPDELFDPDDDFARGFERGAVGRRLELERQARSAEGDSTTNGEFIVVVIAHGERNDAHRIRLYCGSSTSATAFAKKSTTFLLRTEH